MITKKGQAILELAIFGTIILFVFNMILAYGQRLDSKQRLKKEAFRKALQWAYYKNSAITYTKKQDTRITELFSGYGLGQPAATLATATVMWQKGQPGKQDSDDEQGFSYYELNDKVIELPRTRKTVIGNSGEETEITTPASIWKEETVKNTEYTSKIEKKEGNFLGQENQGIKNTRQADLEETITTNLYVRFDKQKYDARDSPNEQPLPDYDYYSAPETTVQGAYLRDNRIAYNEANVGTTIHKQRTWQTTE
jgi:hypothetical protein